MLFCDHSTFGNAYVTLFTIDPVRTLKVTLAVLVNTSGAQNVNVWIHICDPNEAPGVANAIMFSYQMTVDSRLEFFQGGQVMPGQSLIAKSDQVNLIGFRICGELIAD